MRVRAALFYLAVMTVGLARSGDILAWIDSGSKSHFEIWKPLIMALLDRNHSVTIVSPFDFKEAEKHPKVRYAKAGMILDEDFDSKAIFEGKGDPDPRKLVQKFKIAQERAANSPEVQRMLTEKPKFDVAVVSPTSMGVATYVTKVVLNVPRIYIAPAQRLGTFDFAMGNPVFPAYMPETVVSYGQHMNFLQRLHNTLVTYGLHIFFSYYVIPRVAEGVKEVLKLEEVPDLVSIYSTADFAFHNGHPVFEYVAPLNPNTALIGGIHCRPPKPLPKDLQSWLDNATDGAILVSYGSILKAKDMPEEKRLAFVNTFRRLKQRVIWKWESEVPMADKPDNVMLYKWIPQQDVLGHPNLKLFITHGGMLSIEESVYHEVPIVVLPGFGDQPSNAARAERMGHGLKLSWPDVHDDTLYAKVIEILNNDTYAEKTSLYGGILKDNLRSSLDKAVFYTEYVMRHQGAPFLRSAGKDLYWFQYLLLDVWAFVGSIIFVVFFSLYKVVKLLLSCLCGRGKSRKQKDKRKKKTN